MSPTDGLWLALGTVLTSTIIFHLLFLLHRTTVPMHLFSHSRAESSCIVVVRTVLLRAEAVELLLRRCVHRSVITPVEDESITEVARLALGLGIISPTHLDDWIESLSARRRMLTLWDSRRSMTLDYKQTKGRLDSLIDHLESVEAQIEANETAAQKAEESAKRSAERILSTKGNGPE